jgi:hypothetical protein
VRLGGAGRIAHIHSFVQVSVEGSGRIAYLYACPLAWDMRRPSEGMQDKRLYRPLPIFRADLEKFLQSVHSLVTPSSEAYIVVMIGRSKRQGAGPTSTNTDGSWPAATVVRRGSG